VSKNDKAFAVIRRTDERLIVFLVVGIGEPTKSARWPSCRLDGFHVQAQPLQRADHKATRSQFMLQQWVISRASRLTWFCGQKRARRSLRRDQKFFFRPPGHFIFRVTHLLFV